MLILVLAANTSFTGFPFLASFAADDSYLPRQLTRRGHRLVFSTGIIVLTVVSIGPARRHPGPGRQPDPALRHRRVHRLHHGRRRHGQVPPDPPRAALAAPARHQRHGRRCCRSSSILIIAVTKFTEGAWVVVILLPARGAGPAAAPPPVRRARTGSSRQDAAEACEAPVLRRHVVVVLIDRLDLATARAIQYARTLSPDELRAVHFAVDPLEAADLEADWSRLGLSRLPLDIIECPDRRLARAALELAAETTRGRRHRAHHPAAPARLRRRAGGGCCTTAAPTASPPRSATCPTSTPPSSPSSSRRVARTGRGTRGQPRAACRTRRARRPGGGPGIGRERTKSSAPGRRGRPRSARRSGASGCAWPAGSGRSGCPPGRATANLECTLVDGTGAHPPRLPGPAPDPRDPAGGPAGGPGDGGRLGGSAGHPEPRLRADRRARHRRGGPPRLTGPWAGRRALEAAVRAHGRRFLARSSRRVSIVSPPSAGGSAPSSSSCPRTSMRPIV